jgi:cytochrome P450
MTLMDATLSPTTTTCPENMGSMRKSAPDYDQPTTRYEIREDGTWVIYGFAEVRQILRSEFVRQAGFSAETIYEKGAGIMRNLPILFLEGEPHHKARRETNRFFTPSITDRAYREMMNDFADELIAEFRQKKRADLSDLSMEMAVRVASQIVGLTSSLFPGGLKKRLEAMIEVGDQMLTKTPAWITTLVSQWSTTSFFLLDVLPAIRARRENPQEDVISYLIEQDYSNLEIMTECIVYGVAGMVTTREFIAVALWHLFENPHLIERMRVGSQEERYAILHEILRLEPVVGHLYRRTTGDLTFESEGESITIPAGTKLDLHIVAANADEEAMGDSPEALCPMRERAEMRPKVPEFGLSFGDGSHRCPGAFVAIQESDIFIRKLLEVPGLRMEKAPEVTYFQIAESYEIRDFILVAD